MDDKTIEARNELLTKLKRYNGLLEVQTHSGSEAGQNRARNKIQSIEALIALIDLQDVDMCSRRVAPEHILQT
jgi:hypothetical protein